jgi:hypothetical protein|nr:MAG TPA: hypothetical protein [Caudoviricetes sp.]
MDPVSIYHRYFVYSGEEAKRHTKVYGANATLGTVVVKGVSKEYTSIVTNLDGIEPDAIVITKGDIRRIKYTDPVH